MEISIAHEWIESTTWDVQVQQFDALYLLVDLSAWIWRIWR